MKYTPKIPIQVDTVIGTKINLMASLVMLNETAQLIVCDPRYKVENLVCAMNIYQEVRRLRYNCGDRARTAAAAS